MFQYLFTPEEYTACTADREEKVLFWVWPSLGLFEAKSQRLNSLLKKDKKLGISI